MALTRITKGVIKPNENYDTHNINSTGIVTAIGANFTGDVSVGGILTYEDVTSIDSVGIITARQGIHVGAGISVVGVGTFGSLDIGGDIDVDGHTELDNVNIAGIVTVSSDGINAGILDLKTGNNIRLRFSSGGTAQFRGDVDPIASFDRGSANSTNVKWGYLGADRGIISSTSGEFRLTASGTTPMTFHNGGSESLRILSDGTIQYKTAGGKGYEFGASGSSASTAANVFAPASYTLAFGTNGNERLRIDSSGRVMIGTTTEGFAEGDDLTINSADHGGITIRTPSNKEGNIAFSDTTSGTGEYSGLIRYRHSQNDLGLWTNSLLRLLIDSSGRLLLGTTTEGNAGSDDLTIATSGSTGITVRSGTSGNGNLYFSDGTSGDDEYRGSIQYQHANNALLFATDAVERFRIMSDGKLMTQAAGQIYTASSAGSLTLAGGNTNLGGKIVLSGGNSPSTGDIRFYAQMSQSSPAERLRITSTGDINVHNTTAASSTDPVTLDLGGQFTPNASITQANLKLKLYHNGAVSDTMGITASAEGLAFVSSNNTNLIFYTVPNSINNLQERLRIASNGKIGINNNNPTHPLHIVNTSSTFNSASLIKGDTSTSGGGAYVTFTNTADSKSAYFGVDGNGLFNINPGAALVGTNGDESIIFCTNGNSQKARITSGGVVETSSTFSIANVGGSIGGSGGLENWIGLRDTSGNYGLIMKTHSQTAANIRNVGINETDPSEKLQIDGDILLGGQANASESNYAIKFEYNNHQFAKIVGDGRDQSGYGDIDFYTSTGSGVSNLTQRMSIRADGKIGIVDANNNGTISAALHVINSAPEIRITNTTQPNSADCGKLRITEYANSYMGGYMHYDGNSNVLHFGVHENNDSSTSNDENAISIDRDTGKVHIRYGGNTKLTTTSSGVDFDSGTSTLVNIKGDSGGTAGLRLGGDSSQDQCTGFVEVHQDETHGGGMFYNGDGSPSFATGEAADYFSLFRASGGSRHSVMRWFHNSNDCHVQGNMYIDNGATSLLRVTGDSSGTAGVSAGGDSSQTQCTGYLEVHQDRIHGGGISYNGDGSPAFVNGESADRVTFYRMDGGTRHRVFDVPYNSSGVNFASNIEVQGSIFNYNSANTNRGYFSTSTSAQNATNSPTLSGTIHYGFGYQEGYSTSNGGWSNPYPNLVLGYHTGVQIGGHPNYNGTRFYNDHPSATTSIVLNVGNGNNGVGVPHSLSKGGGTFRIRHPHPSKKYTHDLQHSFIEGPQCDNIYRGKVNLVAGSATVNIDTVSNMTDGTFVLLNRDIQCFTSNETGWTAVKGSVTGNILTITAQDNSCTDTISWMVIGERQDDKIKSPDMDITDADGKLIVEPLTIELSHM